MNLEEASKYHRAVVMCFLIYLPFVLATKYVPEGSPFISLGVIIIGFNVYFCFKLAKSLDKNGLLWGVLAFFGFVLLWIPQLILVSSANRAFKAVGKRVNFLGGATESEWP